MRIQFGLLLAMILFLAGCSDHVGLSGKVTFSDTGEPVPLGEIIFSTPTFMSRATIKPDGTFVVGTYKEDDGLPPDTYDVMITSMPPGEVQSEEGKSLIDLKYADRQTSGLKVEVDASTKKMDFVVDRPKNGTPDQNQPL